MVTDVMGFELPGVAYRAPIFSFLISNLIIDYNNITDYLNPLPL